jgi:hypothetical protein
MTVAKTVVGAFLLWGFCGCGYAEPTTESARKVLAELQDEVYVLLSVFVARLLNNGSRLVYRVVLLLCIKRYKIK